MAMQYDVLSVHNTVSGVAVPFRTRLKGVSISPTVHASTFNVRRFVINVSHTGTYATVSASTTLTVTIATAHGLDTGDQVMI
jgi:hypothetical protein